VLIEAGGGSDVSREPHLRPDDLAPATGTYQEHNVFGTATGRTVVAKESEPLPSLPRGFTWSAVPCADE
jgi:hypothetical protein